MKLNRSYIHIGFLVVFVVVAVRLALIWRERYEAERPAQTEQPARLDPDVFVMPKRLHAYDLKSARAVTQGPAWVKEGYRYYYYPYDAGSHRSDLVHEAGTLGPIERVQFQDVEAEAIPGGHGRKEILGIFDKEGKKYAVAIGQSGGESSDIWLDEQFFFQDPHELYKHWPAEVWQAIEAHQVKPGMNELQADFAIGYGTPDRDNGNEKTVHYPNGGKKLAVTYRDGRAVEIRAE